MAGKTVREKLESAVERGKPFGPEAKSPARKVPAKTLRELICERPENEGEGTRCLWLRNIRIADALDLRGQRIGLRLRFENCRFEDSVDLHQACAADVRLVDCTFDGDLTATQIDVRWNLRLDGTTARRGMMLSGARIGGQLSMAGTTLEGAAGAGGARGSALHADGLEVAQGVFLRSGFSSVGEVRMLGAQVGGQLSMTGATLEGSRGENDTRGTAFNADRAEVGGGVFLKGLSSKGLVRLLGAKVGGQLSMTGATLEGSRGENDTRGTAFNADLAEVGGDLFCNDVTATGELRLLGARVGGELSMAGATLEGGKGEDGMADALSADGIDVAGDFRLQEGFTARGSVRLLGARVGGQLSMTGATLEGAKTENDTWSAALDADRAEVGGGMLCEGLSVKGQVRLSGAKIGGRLSLTRATLEALQDDDGTWNAAFNGDRADIGGDFFCSELTAVGEVRMLGAKVGGQLSLNKATLEGMEDDDGMADAFSADDIEVAGNLFCAEISTVGDFRLLGAKVGGQLSMQKAKLQGKQARDGRADAFSADRIEVAGGMLCDELTAVGQVRLPGARIDQLLTMDGASLEGAKQGDGPRSPALNAEGIQVTGSMFCSEGFSAVGELRLPSAAINGQLAVSGARLSGEPTPGTRLDLVGAGIDELILAFDEVDGSIDLRNVSVRSLWDAEHGRLAGRLPQKLRLEGFSYRSLREPLDAGQRLDWLEPSQRERHYPGVYAELAEAFRRIGHASDARRVAIASERRARQDTGRWSYRRLGHDLLWLTIGYGYRNWLAAIWLLGLIAVGSVLFALGEDTFVQAIPTPPSFNPVLYAVDITIPVLDLGQTRAWSATGCLAWVGLVLAAAGYALVAAVIAAAAGLFNRDQA